MKKLLSFFLVISVLLFQSCEKEKDSIENDVLKTLTINATTHTFVNDNNTTYVENTLTSQQDKNVYKLAMTKGVQYRIVVTQPNTVSVQTKLTLVNIKQDTLAESLNETPSKSLIVISSPETANYYLIVNLQKRTNPTFDYRLYFEELTDDALTFSGLNWNSNGQWKVNTATSADLTNTGSNIYRHLKLTSPMTGNESVSFVIQNSSGSNINFGLVLSASDVYLQFSEWAYELANSGYAFFAFRNDLKYTFIKMTSGNMSFEWNTLGTINLDFMTGVKVDLKYESGQYYVYLNGTKLKSIGGTLQNFTLLVQDTDGGTTTIKNFQAVS